MPVTALHVAPRALYDAVVNATTDEERTAARAALDEYKGSNGVCTRCRTCASEDGENRFKEGNKMHMRALRAGRKAAAAAAEA